MQYQECVVKGASIGRQLPVCPEEPSARRWYWSDWMFIGTEHAMSPLSSMAAVGLVHFDAEDRCFGLCQEEQTALHLRRAGASLIPIRAHELVDRLNRFTWLPCTASPLLTAEQLFHEHAITESYWPCPAPAPKAARLCNLTARASHAFFVRTSPPPSSPPSLKNTTFFLIHSVS